jgi:asparagine synthase (glutamine-hydrolysing)
MCGIAGVLNLAEAPPPEESLVRRMLGMIRHRGPDEFGLYHDARIGLGSARLKIVDLSTGQQPIANEDGTLWIVFNGEIFNHVELRPELEARGHRFRTRSDTEVVLHLYEERGPACLERLNGQFAIAIWDARARTLFLARDRLGVRPLFYAQDGARLVFGSEIKSILADRRIRTELDPLVLDQVFTFWAPLSPRTIFRGIL